MVGRDYSQPDMDKFFAVCDHQQNAYFRTLLCGDLRMQEARWLEVSAIFDGLISGIRTTNLGFGIRKSLSLMPIFWLENAPRRTSLLQSVWLSLPRSRQAER
jgi:hypothetical protein